MVKILLLVCTLIVSILSIQAQEKSDRFSIKTGFSNSTQGKYLSPISHIRPYDKSIQSIFVNFQYSFPFKNKEINIGLQFIEKGFRVKYDFYETQLVSTDLEYQYRLNYIEFPINFVYKVKRFKLMTGAIISYLYEDNYRFKTTIINKNNPIIIYQINDARVYSNQIDRLNRWDFGVNVGIAYNLISYLDAELTIQRNFIQIDKWKQQELVYNMSFLLGLRYRLFERSQ